MRAGEMVGKTYGVFKVLRVAEARKNLQAYGLIVQCLLCGSEKEKRAASIRGKHQLKSCGCAKNDNISKAHMKHGNSKRSYRGGMSGTYNAWGHARGRCLNPRNPRFSDYGGRGIRMCERWACSFENFLADMGPRPGAGFSLERKLVDGDYCPENCCWILMLDQAKNKRTNVVITFNGETTYLSEWARRCGITESLLRYRIKKGWPLEKAMSQDRHKSRISPKIQET